MKTFTPLPMVMLAACSMTSKLTERPSTWTEPAAPTSAPFEEEVAREAVQFSAVVDEPQIRVSAVQYGKCAKFQTTPMQRWSGTTRELDKTWPVILDFALGPLLAAGGAKLIANASIYSAETAVDEQGQPQASDRTVAYTFGGVLAAWGLSHFGYGIYKAVRAIDSTNAGATFDERTQLGEPYQCKPTYFEGQPVSVEIGGERIEAKLDSNGKAVLALPAKEALVREVGDYPAGAPIVAVRFSRPGETANRQRLERKVDLRKLPAFAKVAVEHLTGVLEKKAAEREHNLDLTCGQWVGTYPDLNCKRYQQMVSRWRTEDAAEAAERSEAERLAAQEEAARQNEVREAVRAQLRKWESALPYSKLLEHSDIYGIDWLSKNPDAVLVSGAKSLAVAVQELRGANSRLARIQELASSLDPADIKTGYLWRHFNHSAQPLRTLVPFFSARVEAARSPQFCPRDFEIFVRAGASQCERGLSNELMGEGCVFVCMPDACRGSPAAFNFLCFKMYEHCTQRCAGKEEKMVSNRNWNQSPARRKCEKTAFALRCKKQRQIKRWVGNVDVDELRVEVFDLSLFYSQLLNGIRALNPFIGGTRANLYSYARQGLGRSDEQILQVILTTYQDTPPNEWNAETILEALGSRHGLF